MVSIKKKPRNSSNMMPLDKSSVFMPLVLGGLLLVVNVGHTVFAQMAANDDGSFPFHESSAVLVSEFGKMILAMVLLGRAYRTTSSNSTTAMTGNLKFTLTRQIIAEMAVPGMLYTMSNILSYTTVGLLGSTNYQLFSNIKIVITAVTFRLILQKRLKVIQWVCLLFLTTGLLVATTGNNNTSASSSNSNNDISYYDKSRLVSGFVLMVLLSLASSFAGVFSELKLKQAPQHPMLQNALMYAWSCVFCLAQYNYNASKLDGGFFQGFSWPLWGAILTTAIYGQVVALIFYYCDNIVKVFANSATVIASALVDQVLWKKPLTIQIGIAGSIIFCSTVIYYGNHSLLLSDDVQFLENHVRRWTSPLPLHSTAGKRPWYSRARTLCLAGIILFVSLSFSLFSSTEVIAPPVASNSLTEMPLPKDNMTHNSPCDWPPPLYHPYKNNKPDDGLIQAMQTAKRFFDEHPDTTFSYIDSGGALGAYRDGSLIPGDSDLDVRFGICRSCGGSDISLPKLNSSFISANDYAVWGDVWTRRQIVIETDALHVQQVKRDLCLHEYAPGQSYWFHRSAMQRRAFQYTYGDFWFVRMPWKGMHNVEMWNNYAKTNKNHAIPPPDGFQANWDKSIEQITKIDTNRNGEISEAELKARVLADGIIPQRFQTQISSRERCRAAKMMSFLLKFNAEPFVISKPANCFLGCLSNADHPLFRFPECNGK